MTKAKEQKAEIHIGQPIKVERKKIAIVGTAPTSMLKANDLDDSWTIYSCNGAFNHLKRFDLHFELHDIDYLRGDEVKCDPTYFQFFHDVGGKIVLNRLYDEFPDAQAYPLQEVTEGIKSTYFNNTIAYMMAFAMYRHPEMTDMALLGVDMSGDGEYAHQRPCCEFYLGMAKAKGISIHMPDTSPMLKNSHLYGFEPLPHHVVLLKQQIKTSKVMDKQYEEAKRVADKNYNYNRGMVDLLEAQLKRAY